MSITHELREWAENNTLKDMMLPTCPPQHVVRGVLETLLRIADRIDAEHERKVADTRNDALYRTNEKDRANECRHYHATTVEGVLDEFASAYDRIGGADEEHQLYLNLIAEYAAKLRLLGDAE